MRPISDMLNKITITGDLGSGKSAVSKILCTKTGFSYVSTGKIQRQLAAELGLDTLAMNLLADVDPSVDDRIDSVFISLGHDEIPYVVDSRLGWFFLPDSFKVYLTVSLDVAAERILQDASRQQTEQYEGRQEAIAKLRARKQSENQRFLTKYGADSTNLNNFDLVVDTTSRTPDAVAEIILQGFEAKQNGAAFDRFF